MKEDIKYITKYILLKIFSGEWSNDKLPSERWIGQKLNCTRNAVRHALEQLKNAEIIYSVHGKGHFIQKKHNGSWIEPHDDEKVIYRNPTLKDRKILYRIDNDIRGNLITRIVKKDREIIACTFIIISHPFIVGSIQHPFPNLLQYLAKNGVIFNISKERQEYCESNFSILSTKVSTICINNMWDMDGVYIGKTITIMKPSLFNNETTKRII